MTEEKWEAVVSEIGRSFGLVGTSTQYGRSLQWTYHSRFQDTQVTVSPRGGRTRIRIQSSYPRTAGLFLPFVFFGFSVMLAVPASNDFSPLGTAGFLLSVALVLLSAAAFALGAVSRKKQRDAKALMARR